MVLHLRARPVRRLQFGHRAPCPEAINRLLADGKQVKILCVGKKGFDQLKRLYAPLIIDPIDFRGVRQLSFELA